ncbi:hypothetical protein SAMN05216464_118125 [Mucilaginibacter pineti]|uniref:Xaa-Pro dipeptidyl-peptidase C-terminal domain-containing protein n=1 Tax=Mucilaginibacter pineti TaxID=1391627 RepID=A0A1G7LD64_9SPHI|nr:CocE/NonD family hydrolase [Mucilaginibacter pineti]SDF47428.1 hypothetical protein SAMN05216464_118125 [Mucilaginibacter pineti]
MKRNICMALLCLFITHFAMAQHLSISHIVANDSISIEREISSLAAGVMKSYTDENRKDLLENEFKLQMLTGDYRASLATIKALYAISLQVSPYKIPSYLAYEIFAKNMVGQVSNPAAFAKTYTALFNSTLEKLDDKSAYCSYGSFPRSDGIGALKDAFQNELSSAQKKEKLSISEALLLCISYYDLRFSQKTSAIVMPLIMADCRRRYKLKSQLVTITGDIRINVVTVLKKGDTHPQPAALQYTIYADSTDLRLFAPAAYGYAAVTAYSRGKGLSPDKIVPYEHDGEDANAIITWISKQHWCNGKVGMYGGSYNGFTQWAAAKYHNPALKTIVPYVAAIPGLGLPMENNVFLNANYGWAFYTTDNKYLNNKVYNDPSRWRSLNWKWFNSGAEYNKIDSVDGRPNPWLQRWLKHPDYDRYWQQQVPYQHDFANINIPVLTFEGYYDDGQISGLHYYLEHLQYNAKADHYLIVGPYDHFGTQSGGVPVLRGYKIDPIALMSTRDITFQWFDHIFKGAKMPEIIKNRVNYEIMGANKWKHVPSVARMADERLKLYLTDLKDGKNYMLSTSKRQDKAWLAENVNLDDRKTLYGDYYPFPIIKDSIDRSNGLFFLSKPFDEPITVSGIFSGELKAIINKKDMDITVTLYELTPDEKHFELSYFLGRASYARDMTRRILLQPGKEETLPFKRTRMVSRQLGKGSRLLIVLNIDKNPFAEVNYGTGKNVAEETMTDGKIPLKVKWANGSYIEVPVMR